MCIFVCVVVINVSVSGSSSVQRVHNKTITFRNIESCRGFVWGASFCKLILGVEYRVGLFSFFLFINLS